VVWTIAAGILIAAIPVSIIGFGFGMADAGLKTDGESWAGWVVAGFGAFIGAAIILKALL
jgi:hypothetical protein